MSKNHAHMARKKLAPAPPCRRVKLEDELTAQIAELVRRNDVCARREERRLKLRLEAVRAMQGRVGEAEVHA